MAGGILAKGLCGLVGVLALVSTPRGQVLPLQTVKIPDGTVIHLVLKDELDSKTNRKDDLIRYQVREDVVVGRVVVIPAGSPAQGHILAVGHRGMAGHSGRLTFSVDYVLAPDGTKVPVASTPSVTGGSNGKVAAAAAATYGPEALLMRGWNADIRKGTVLNAYVTDDHEIGMANLTIQPSFGSDADQSGQTTTDALRHQANQPGAPPPTIVLVNPFVSASGDVIHVATSTIKIRGGVSDPAGLPAVAINGTAAALLANGPHSADFNFGPVQLQAGDNRFEVVATNGANAQTKIRFVVVYDSNTQTTAPPSL